MNGIKDLRTNTRILEAELQLKKMSKGSFVQLV